MTMQLSPKKESAHAFKIFFRFDDLNRETPLVVDCSVKVSFINDMTAELSSTGGYFNYRKKRTPMKSFYCRGAAVPGIPLPGYLSLSLSLHTPPPHSPPSLFLFSVSVCDYPQICTTFIVSCKTLGGRRGFFFFSFLVTKAFFAVLLSHSVLLVSLTEMLKPSVIKKHAFGAGFLQIQTDPSAHNLNTQKLLA